MKGNFDEKKVTKITELLSEAVAEAGFGDDPEAQRLLGKVRDAGMKLVGKEKDGEEDEKPIKTVKMTKEVMLAWKEFKDATKPLRKKAEEARALAERLQVLKKELNGLVQEDSYVHGKERFWAAVSFFMKLPSKKYSMQVNEDTDEIEILGEKDGDE